MGERFAVYLRLRSGASSYELPQYLERQPLDRLQSWFAVGKERTINIRWDSGEEVTLDREGIVVVEAVRQ